MTREEVLRWAEEADLYQDGKFFVCDADELVRFAALVAAAEREACADICDQHASVEGIAQRCADAIRARSQKESPPV
jgi:hypothetical protein